MVRSAEQKLAAKLRKRAVRVAQKERAWRKHPANVRYAKANYKKGAKRQRRRKVKIEVGVQK